MAGAEDFFLGNRSGGTYRGRQPRSRHGEGLPGGVVADARQTKPHQTAGVCGKPHYINPQIGNLD